MMVVDQYAIFTDAALAGRRRQAKAVELPNLAEVSNMSDPDRKISSQLARLGHLKLVRYGLAAALAAAVATYVIAGTPGSARWAGPINLGNAASFAVLAGTSVVNQNADTTVDGHLGVSPGNTVTGFPPGIVQNGAIHAGDSLAASARSDIIAVRNDLASRTPVTTIPSQLGGTTIGPGIFGASNEAFTINGQLVLDAQRDPDSIFVFKANSLDTAQSSSIKLTRGAQINNVFFLINNTATLGQWTTFKANVIAQDTVRVIPGVFVSGRLFALDNSVIMETNAAGLSTHIGLPDNPPTTTTLASSPNPSQQGQGVTLTATVSAVFAPVDPKGEVVFKDGPTIIGSDFIDNNKTATFTTSALAPGTHQITAVYIGGDTPFNEAIITFAPSKSSPVSQEVLASLFGAFTTPAVESHTDAQAVTLGVKFTAKISGTITGIRFYKGTQNTGAHTGALWTIGGQLLATASFSNETASGWQQVTFSTPVTIAPNTTYVASYHTTSGRYSITRPYFTTEQTNGELTALADGAQGGNGVYTYGASLAFPTSTFQATNYWVDVTFVPASSLWPSTTTPAVDSHHDSQPVTLGVKFQATASGTITGIRFYKGASNTGTHVGSLWSATGTLLAQATFTNETASGWQQVTFGSPVAISANTTYIASYHNSSGFHSMTRPYFTEQYTRGSLIALADDAQGGNGVYTYGASSTFPTNSFQATNYWVDVAFKFA
jgi:hypothetical protein